MEGYQPGVYRPYIAPGGGVVKGTPLLIGGVVVIPLETAVAAATFTGFVGPGRINGLPKVAGVALAEGAVVRFIGATANFAAAILAGNYIVGTAAKAAAAGDATVDVYFDGAVHLGGV